MHALPSEPSSIEDTRLRASLMLFPRLWRKVALAGFIFLAASMQGPALAQTAEDKAAIESAIGEQTAETLLDVRDAVNALAVGWGKRQFEAERAAELAASYHASAAQMLAILQQTMSPYPEAARVIAGAESLVLQSSALVDWVGAGHHSPSPPYLAAMVATDKLLFPHGTEGAEPIAAARTEKALLRIVRSTAPSGKAYNLGVMSVVHTSESVPEQVTWTYEDGSVDKGLGVPLPGTGMLAVSFGVDVKSIHLYRLVSSGGDARTIEGRWAPSVPDAKIREIRMTAASDAPLPTEFNFDGGATFSMQERATGKPLAVKWKFPDNGEIQGVGVIFGDYIAAIATNPGKSNGVTLYAMSPEGDKAASRWVVSGFDGVGTEDLVVTQLPDRVAPVDSAETVYFDGEIRQIAEALRDNIGNAVRWKPTPAQIDAIAATEADANALRAYVEFIYAEAVSDQPAAKAGQTQIVVIGPDLSELPDRYRTQMAHYRPGTKFYGFKYLEPGKDAGMRYDGLIRVDGAWIFIPKASLAFSE